MDRIKQNMHKTEDLSGTLSMFFELLFYKNDDIIIY